ncbi:hypothetical protein V8B97DRAFT_1919509 [Scleroderma yunnanense]
MSMKANPPISSRQAKSSNMKQWLWEDELDILKQFLKDWTAGDTAQRQTIFKNVGDCIQHLAPNRMLKSCQWDMKAKAMCLFFYNCSCMWSRKKLLTYGHKWTQTAVITHQQKDRINRVLEKSGLKPGTKQWIGKYQAVVGKVMKKMSSEEVAAAIVTAEKWNKTCPPPEVQSRAAEQKGRKYTQQFAEEVWKQCGMQVMVMVAWKGPDRDDLTSLSQMVKCLITGGIWKTGGASMPMTCLDPQKAPNPMTVVKKLHYRKKSERLPVILNMVGREKKALMCAFAAFHYRKACGQQSATVPWGAISDDVEKYISPEYLPADVRFKELTKLSINETTRILEWWQDWQEGSPNDIFRFKMWINSDGPVHSPVSARHQQLKVTRKQKQHVKDNLDDTEDNDEHGNMKDGGDELHLERDETSEMESSNADSCKATPITHSSIKAGNVPQETLSYDPSF